MPLRRKPTCVGLSEQRAGAFPERPLWRPTCARVDEYANNNGATSVTKKQFQVVLGFCGGP
jgi:hypothetical protein